MSDAAATTTNAPDAQRAGAAPLLAPLTLRELTLRNRVVVSPMQMYSAHDGVVGDWHLVHLGRFALGGAGLVIVEATAVCPEGRSTLHDNGLWNETQADAFARITAFLRANGAASAIQLQHAGRKASSQAPWDGFGPLGERDAARGEAPWQPWGPTRAGWSDAHPATRPIGDAEVGYLLARYTHATRLALRAGFDAIEIHAAHGYLLHSFLSPLVEHARRRVRRRSRGPHAPAAAGRRRRARRVARGAPAVLPHVDGGRRRDRLVARRLGRTGAAPARARRRRRRLLVRRHEPARPRRAS